MQWLRIRWQNAAAFILSIWTWHFHRTLGRRYQAQGDVVAAWVVRQVRTMLHGQITADLSWDLDQFQLCLARLLYTEIVKNQGYYPISNSPHQSPPALFEQALKAARVYPPEPVLQALPFVRIRIIPGWVKVYAMGDVLNGPTILYPLRFAHRHP